MHDDTARATVPAGTTVRRTAVACDLPDPLARIAADLGCGLGQVFLFVDGTADFEGIVAQASTAFPQAQVVACTTAGEISPAEGYCDGHIVAVGLPRDHFDCTALLVTDLDRLDARGLIGDVIRTRMTLDARAPDKPHAFAFVVVDGLSRCEDQLMGVLASGMASTPVFGGSAGDGVRFRDAKVALDGRVYRNAAVVTFVRTDCRVRVFSLDHFRPGDAKMVVTRADPSLRLVSEINARPAAREYARMLGKNPDFLSPFTFAAHPLVVRIGGHHHVRAIQRMTEEGALIFFSAIDEGIVLTLAHAEDMAGHLDRALGALSEAGPLDTILACDCVLRRIEATEGQLAHRISQTMRAHHVVGFNTYGEQTGGKHVNQTMTGVAIYAPDAGPAA